MACRAQNSRFLSNICSKRELRVSFCWPGEKIFIVANSIMPKRFFEPLSGEKNVLGLSRGSGGMLPQKILKI